MKEVILVSLGSDGDTGWKSARPFGLQEDRMDPKECVLIMGIVVPGMRARGGKVLESECFREHRTLLLID
jgi:hypothetical protein